MLYFPFLSIIAAMTTAVSPKQQPLVFSDHWELLSRAASALTVDPYKSALYYFFPLLGAWLSDSYPLQIQEPMMPQGPAALALKEIEDLTQRAKIKAIPYTGLYHQFSNCGGTLSATKPILFIPYQHLFRPNGRPPFGGETPEEQLSAERWVFSDEETRFLIARELGQIKENSALLRIAIKVALIGAIFTICATSFGWPLGISLLASAMGMYIVSERFFQGRADIVGAEISGSIPTAIAALEKIQQQNLERREQNSLAAWYITEAGNNLLDFTRPLLTTRINSLYKLS